jgi:predicted metal-binding membrane protein
MAGVNQRSQLWAPVLIASAVAWMLLAFQPMPAFCSISMMQAADLKEPASALNLVASFSSGWALMLAAMMLPSLVISIRHVRDQSFTDRRVRSIAFFLAGYGAVWLLAGAVLLALASAIHRIDDRTELLAVSGIAILWQCSPLKQRCLNRNHAHPALSAFGWVADLDAFRFGARHGFWCFGSCWALMLLTMVVSRGQVAIMFTVAMWLFAERLERPMAPCWSFRGPGKAARLLVAQMRLGLKHIEKSMS